MSHFPSSSKTALVTGVNGYIGSAIAQAFTIAGYTTYGLIRSPNRALTLAAQEVTAIVGSINSPQSILSDLYTFTKTVDVIVCCTEDHTDWLGHFNAVLALLRELSKTSNAHGVRPLVIFTSGCKDYGMTSFHGSDGLAAHTEQSPLNPPMFLRLRADNSTEVFRESDFFDAVVTRPTTIYGRSSSYYAVLFDAAAQAAGEKNGDGRSMLRLPADERSIMHGTHVSDITSAYLAIASAPREVVRGQVYNISSHRYETLEEVGTALAREYGIDEVRYTSGNRFSDNYKFLGDMLLTVTGFSQWVGSEKLRKDTGWKDVRPLFSEAVGVWRRAFEAVA